jgi:hypothetical protein
MGDSVVKALGERFKRQHPKYLHREVKILSPLIQNL